LEIYATSIDYNPNAEATKKFFQIVQNKLHWAAHGHTAAEIVFERANAEKPFMGLTAFTGRLPQKNEITVAKNYLSKEELEILNRLVSAYLDIAEVYSGPQNSDSVISYTWDTKRGGPSGANAQEVSAFI